MTVLWHYTCDHGREALGDAGLLLSPYEQGVDPQRFPRWARDLAYLVWLTDLETPFVSALGLTKETLDCDRTRHRYQVSGGVTWKWLDVRRVLQPRLVAELEQAPGACPGNWWVARGPLHVAYNPIRAVASA